MTFDDPFAVPAKNRVVSCADGGEEVREVDWDCKFRTSSFVLLLRARIPLLRLDPHHTHLVRSAWRTTCGLGHPPL